MYTLLFPLHIITTQIQVKKFAFLLYIRAVGTQCVVHIRLLFLSAVAIAYCILQEAFVLGAVGLPHHSLLLHRGTDHEHVH